MLTRARHPLWLTAFTLIPMWTALTASASIGHDENASYCPQRIVASICVVSPMRRLLRRSDVLQRRCLPGREDYAATILDTYARLPRPLQQRMCGLERIFIERSFWASGYAHPKTNTIGIHQRMFEDQRTLSQWATWKEQLPFRLDDIAKHITTGRSIELPRIIVDAPGKPISSAFFIIVHELAHRIDLEHGLSRFRKSKFAEISWRIHKRYIKSAHLPPSWTVPCFYRCEGDKIPLSDIRTVYKDLQSGGFVSLYASRHPSEDFAETLTYYVLSQQKDLRLELRAGNAKLLDLNSMLKSQLIRRKFDYMKDLLSRGK